MTEIYYKDLYFVRMCDIMSIYIIKKKDREMRDKILVRIIKNSYVSVCRFGLGTA